MTIRDMHYDFRKKLNKIDSAQYRNITIPEVDRILNEAANIFVKSIANPRFAKEVGLEMNQRTIEDLRTIIIDEFSLAATTTNNIDYYVTLPLDYQFYINSKVVAVKPSCTNSVICDVIVRKHSEEHRSSPFDESSFEWREINIHFVGNQIRIFTDGTFSVSALLLDYLTIMPYMHNAQDFQGGTYTLPSGTVLTLSQDCVLPDIVHLEIVDLAVLLTSMELNSQDLQLKQNKIQLNQ